MNLDGATVVVTGAGSGIGRAIAARMAADGARVVINDIDPDAAADAAASMGAACVPGDASSEEAIAGLVAAATEELGEIDIWFSNAGVDRGRGLSTSEADWDLSYQLHVMAHVRAARLLLPGWLERGRGRFVITASAAGLLMALGSPAYTATKAASVSFGEWLSATYRHRGIVVQALCPQAVQTSMLEATGAAKDLIAHDGILQPEQVADAVRAALDTEDFLILPHREVASYLSAKGTDMDRWLRAMSRLQQKMEAFDS